MNIIWEIDYPNGVRATDNPAGSIHPKLVDMLWEMVACGSSWLLPGQ